MGNFQGGGNRGGGGFRGGNRGGRPSYGDNRGGDRREVTMHKAVCDECQKDCQVPFRPSSDKPIYCNDCFSNKREDQPRRDYGNDRGPRKDFSNRSNRGASFSKPVPAQDDLKNQFRELNVKLDRLLSAIEKIPQSTKVEAKNKTKFTPTIGPVKKKKTIKDTPNLKAVIKKAIKTKTVAKKKTKVVKKAKVASKVKPAKAKVKAKKAPVKKKK